MVKFRYTIDLGRAYGQRLEEFSVQGCFDTVEDFAAMLLRFAIDSVELEMDEAAKQAGPERSASEGHDLDDDIPF
jgi:hypothetical protein